MDALLSTLVQLTNDKDLVVIRGPLVRFTGSVEAAILLGQLLYWTPRAQIPGGWIAKTDDEFTAELFLSRYQLRQAREQLEKLGTLETTVRRFSGSPTVHYRIIQGELIAQWKVWISHNGSSENVQSCTETTAETTTEPTSTVTIDSVVSGVPDTTALAPTKLADSPVLEEQAPAEECPAETPAAKGNGRKGDGVLLPDTPEARKAFGRLIANAQAQHRRGPRKFPTLEVKQRFDTAVAVLDSDFERALDGALQQGITSVVGVTNYLTAWSKRKGASNVIRIKA